MRFFSEKSLEDRDFDQPSCRGRLVGRSTFDSARDKLAAVHQRREQSYVRGGRRVKVGFIGASVLITLICY